MGARTTGFVMGLVGLAQKEKSPVNDEALKIPRSSGLT